MQQLDDGADGAAGALELELGLLDLLEQQAVELEEALRHAVVAVVEGTSPPELALTCVGKNHTLVNGRVLTKGAMFDDAYTFERRLDATIRLGVRQAAIESKLEKKKIEERRGERTKDAEPFFGACFISLNIDIFFRG